MTTSAARTLTLPSELKLQILLEDVLSCRDLTRICRIDKSWLHCGREVLFKTVVVEIRWNQDDNSEEIDDEEREREQQEEGELDGRGGLSERAFQLLLTLQNDSQLVKLVRSIRFESRHALKTGKRSVSHAIAAFLEACPTIKSVSFSQKLSERFEECILQCVELLRVGIHSISLDREWLIFVDKTYDSDSILVQNLRNLRMLECADIRYFSNDDHDRSFRYPLVNLEVLQLHRPSYSTALSATYMPKLQILQFPLFAILAFKDIGHITSLRTLYLGISCKDGRASGADLRILSHHPSLQFLSIRIHTSSELWDKGLKGFLQNLPPLLTHLVFPSRIPFDPLLPLVPSLHSITDLGVSAPLPHEKKKQMNMDKLRSSSEQKGIKLYFTLKREVDVMKLQIL